MQLLLLDFFSLIIVFLIGYGLKRAGILEPKDGSTLLRFIFYVGVPALIITTVPSISLSLDVFWLASLPFIVSSITLASILLLRRSILSDIPKKTFGTLLAGAMIMNTGLLIPVVETVYGSEGLGRLMIIDTLNGVATFSLIYAAILLFGGHTPSRRVVAEKILAAPPTWALLIALVIGLTGTSIPSAIEIPLDFVAGLVGPLILLALGLRFSLVVRHKLLTLVGLAVRFLLGGVIGLILVVATGLSGIDAHIVILAAMAPIGFNAIVLSEKEKLDTDYAASLVSVGIIVAAVLLPAVVYGLSIAFPL